MRTSLTTADLLREFLDSGEAAMRIVPEHGQAAQGVAVSFAKKTKDLGLADDIHVAMRGDKTYLVRKSGAESTRHAKSRTEARA